MPGRHLPRQLVKLLASERSGRFRCQVPLTGHWAEAILKVSSKSAWLVARRAVTAEKTDFNPSPFVT